MLEEKLSAKSKLLTAASNLFYARGIGAVSINDITREARTAYQSFYDNFKSKEELVIGYLRREESIYMEAIDSALSNQQLLNGEKITTCIDSLVKQLSKNSIKRGNAHLNALVEYPDPTHPIHLEVLEFRKRLHTKLAASLKDAGVDKPAQSANTLLFVMDGLHVRSLLGRLPNDSKNIVQSLLNIALHKSKPSIDRGIFVTYNGSFIDGKPTLDKPRPIHICGNCGKTLSTYRKEYEDCNKCNCTCETTKCFKHWRCGCGLKICQFHANNRDKTLKGAIGKLNEQLFSELPLIYNSNAGGHD